MQLTDQQIGRFRTFGFLIFRQLLSPAEVDQFSREFDHGLDRRLGRPHDGLARVWAPLMDADTPLIASLIDDHRFADVAEQLLGKPVLGIVTDGNYYVGDTRWHPDSGSLDWEALKFTIYLDRLDASNGALRVVPGSHRQPLWGEIVTDTVSRFGLQPAELPAFVFESNPGDVLCFNVALWHGAFGGGQHRRMATVGYYEDPQTATATALVQKTIRSNHALQARTWGGQFYPEHWRSVATPRHQRWVRRLAELDVLDTVVPAAPT